MPDSVTAGKQDEPLGGRLIEPRQEYVARLSRILAALDRRPAPGSVPDCLRGVSDPRGITFLTNQYSASGRVICQIQADGRESRFAYINGPPPSLQAARWTRVVAHPPTGVFQLRPCRKSGGTWVEQEP